MWFKNPFKSKRKALFLFPITFACIALFPMFGKGMFMDGILYAIISKNVAQDVCGLWSLKITDSLYPNFNEHPPLVFAFQSLFFKFWGNHYWVERVYSLTTVLISAYLIVKIYLSIVRLTGSTQANGIAPTSVSIGKDGSTKLFGSTGEYVIAQEDSSAQTDGRASTRGIAQKNERKYPSAAWVLLLWISVPVVNRCAQNNMLENTMLVFVLASVWAYLKSHSMQSILSYHPKNHSLSSFVWLFISGCMLYLAFMAKGFTGLFPFSLPLIFFWTNRLTKNPSISHSSAIQQTPETIVNVNQTSHSSSQSDYLKNAIFNAVSEIFFMVVGFVLSFALIIWIFPESLDALQRYFHKQVIGSLEQVQTVSTRFKILLDYVLALLPMVLFSFLLGWYFIYKKTSSRAGVISELVPEFSRFFNTPMVRLLFVLSLTGVIPIMISLKQSDYYIYCVFPFVAMAVIIGIKDIWLTFENQLLNSNKWQPALVIICFIFGGWGFAQSGKVQRDIELWNDIDAIVSTLNQKEGGDSLVLGSFRALKDDWYMQAYLYRYYNITVQNYRVPNDEVKFKYYLVPKNYIRDSLNGMTPLNMQLKKYELWQKKR